MNVHVIRISVTGANKFKTTIAQNVIQNHYDVINVGNILNVTIKPVQLIKVTDLTTVAVSMHIVFTAIYVKGKQTFQKMKLNMKTIVNDKTNKQNKLQLIN